MPASYEKIRDSLRKSGKSLKAAKSEAAAIYNKNHPGHSLAKWIKSHEGGKAKKRK